MRWHKLVPLDRWRRQDLRMKRLIGGGPISLTPNFPLSLGSLAFTKQYQERTKKKATFIYTVSHIWTSPFGKPSLGHTVNFFAISNWPLNCRKSFTKSNPSINFCRFIFSWSISLIYLPCTNELNCLWSPLRITHDIIGNSYHFKNNGRICTLNFKFDCEVIHASQSLSSFNSELIIMKLVWLSN